MPTHSPWTTVLLAGLVCLVLFGVPTAGLAQAPDSAAVQARADALAARADSLKGERQVGPALQAYRQVLALYRQVGADAGGLISGSLGSTDRLGRPALRKKLNAGGCRQDIFGAGLPVGSTEPFEKRLQDRHWMLLERLLENT